MPDFATYFERWEELSKATREKHPAVINVRYGNCELECLDVFPSAKPKSKALVFIHGGYWHLFDKTQFHFIADAFYDDNITTVLINYPLTPTATMDEIVTACRKAILWLHKSLSQFNGDEQQVYIMGNSAGAHLAAMLIEKEWMQQNGAGFIKAVCLLSGIYNLLPVQLLPLNETLNMSIETAMLNSPVELNPAENCPVLISVGADETDEFISQSRELFESWKNKNPVMQILELPGINHYSILETLLDKTSALHVAVRDIMGL